MWRDIVATSPANPFVRRLTPRILREADGAYARWVRQLLPRGRLLAFVAEGKDGRVQGSGALWLQDTQPRPAATESYLPYVLSMYTEPDARGQGVATALIRAMLRWCAEHHYGRVVLHASTMGRGVYRRLGFERTWEMRYVAPALGLTRARRGPAARRSSGGPRRARRAPP